MPKDLTAAHWRSQAMQRVFLNIRSKFSRSLVPEGVDPGKYCYGAKTSEHSVLAPMAVCNDTAPAALTADYVEIDMRRALVCLLCLDRELASHANATLVDSPGP
jgi:hypothetical protein